MSRVYTTKPVLCGHPDRKHYCKNMCQECYCRDRQKRIGKEVARRYRENHQDRCRESDRRKKAANPEKYRELARNAQKRRRKRNLVKAADLDHRARWYGTLKAWRLNRESHLRRMFGLTLDDYDAMLKAQDGVCAICKEQETCTRNGVVKHLAVDHDHKTGKVRGLLCQHCNQLFGHARESVAILRAAIAYLERSA